MQIIRAPLGNRILMIAFGAVFIALFFVVLGLLWFEPARSIPISTRFALTRAFTFPLSHRRGRETPA